MSEPETIHLIGEMRPDVLERWTLWASRNNYTIKRTTFEELEQLSNPLIILDNHGLYDTHLPGDIP